MTSATTDAESLAAALDFARAHDALLSTVPPRVACTRSQPRDALLRRYLTRAGFEPMAAGVWGVG